MTCLYLILALIGFVVLVNLFGTSAEEAAKERERQTRQKREEWLRSPEGQAWSAKVQAEKEQEERRRKEEEEVRARGIWELWHQRRSLVEIHKMTGAEFESFLTNLLARLGYSEIRLTPNTDQGGDILAKTPTGESVVVQAKRWKNPAGNKVVQEILGALLHYGCTKGIVITNNRFTGPAVQLAAKDKRVLLYDGNWLDLRLKELFPENVPEFTWEGYNKLIQQYPQAMTIDRLPAVPHPRPYYHYRRRWKKRRWRY